MTLTIRITESVTDFFGQTPILCDHPELLEKALAAFQSIEEPHLQDPNPHMISAMSHPAWGRVYDLSEKIFYENTPSSIQGKIAYARTYALGFGLSNEQFDAINEQVLIKGLTEPGPLKNASNVREMNQEFVGSSKIARLIYQEEMKRIFISYPSSFPKTSVNALALSVECERAISRLFSVIGRAWDTNHSSAQSPFIEHQKLSAEKAEQYLAIWHFKQKLSEKGLLNKILKAPWTKGKYGQDTIDYITEPFMESLKNEGQWGAWMGVLENIVLNASLKTTLTSDSRPQKEVDADVTNDAKKRVPLKRKRAL